MRVQVIRVERVVGGKSEGEKGWSRGIERVEGSRE